MKPTFVASIVLGVAMAATSALTGALTPTRKAAAAQAPFDLRGMIPRRFGGWTVDDTVAPVVPDATQKALIATLYDQTLARTYVDGGGQRVMLSIAYGGDQSKQLQLHLPEVCYVAQGFELVRDGTATLPTPYGAVPVKRLVARQNTRNEPITYWVTIGDRAVLSGLGQKYQRFLYGLTGRIPDGMLVRVSTVGADAEGAWRAQDRFLNQMLVAMAPRDRTRLLGAATGKD